MGNQRRKRHANHICMNAHMPAHAKYTRWQINCTNLLIFENSKMKNIFITFLKSQRRRHTNPNPPLNPLLKTQCVSGGGTQWVGGRLRFLRHRGPEVRLQLSSCGSAPAIGALTPGLQVPMASLFVWDLEGGLRGNPVPCPMMAARGRQNPFSAERKN